VGKWAIFLQEFDLQIIKQKSKKGMVMDEKLSHAPLPNMDQEYVNDDFPNQSIMHVES